MSKMWDDLKKNLSVWSNAAVEKAEEMSKIAVAKTEELTRISKIKIDIRQLHRDLDKTYEELGRLVRKSADAKKLDFSGDADFRDIMKKIGEIEKVVSEKEKQIQKIKEEYGLKEEDIHEAVAAAVGEPVAEDITEEKPKKSTKK